MPSRIFRLITMGGLGDALLLTPVVKALKEKDPATRVWVFCVSTPYMDVFRNNPYVDRICDITFRHNPVSFTLYYLKFAQFNKFEFAPLFPNLFLRSKAMDTIQKGFQVPIADQSIQVFLTSKEDENAKKFMAAYNNPIIIHPCSYNLKNKEWPMHSWEELIDSLPQYTFLQVGLSSEYKLKNAVDLRGKLTFRTSIAIMKYATAFAGIDSAMSHVTNAFNIPGVVIFGPSHPAIWGHPNNINLYSNQRCAPCMDILKHACPYNKKCMTDITVEEVRSALLTQLHKKNTLSVV